MRYRQPFSLILLVLVGLLAGCARAEAEPIAVAPATTTARATTTLAPTFTPPLPTATLAPTFTPTMPPTVTAEPSPTTEPTRTPDATPTLEPTSTQPPTATAEPTATVATAAVPAQFYLETMMHEYQRLNNCGPTSAAMALSYYGLPFTQYDIAPVTKGADTDKNVTPYELQAFIEAQGFRAPPFVNGDLATVRALVANNIPVIVEQWLERYDDPLTGHFRVVRGYDQAAGVLVVNDSYTGPNMRYTEAEFDRWWRAYGRTYIPVYRPEQEALVRAIVGEATWAPEAMWQGALRRSEEEVATQGDVYAWFNLGTARLRTGDAPGAVAAFEQALAIGLPERMLWDKFGPFEALNAAGQYERTLQLSEAYLGVYVEEIHFYRGAALEALGRPQEAIAEYQTARSLNPRYAAPQEALARLGAG
jgi:tetratricopeptide (TPR) repeat protein